MDKTKEDTTGKICLSYRKQIFEMLERIEDPKILIKIYTVVKTHLEILREKEQED